VYIMIVSMLAIVSSWRISSEKHKISKCTWKQNPFRDSKLTKQFFTTGAIKGFWSSTEPSFLVVGEPEETKWIQADSVHFSLLQSAIQLHDGNVCLDIGGNHGWYSLWMTSLGCDSFYVEMQPTMIARFSLSVALNNFQNKITIYEGGASSDQSEMMMHGDAGGAHLGGSKHANDVSVWTDRIDNCIKSSAISAAKIDVEGFEMRVLDGMGHLINSPRHFLIEVGPARWERANMTLQEGIDIFYRLKTSHTIHLIGRNDTQCPGHTIATWMNSTHDDLIPISWPHVHLLFRQMFASNLDCNLWLVQRT
jgi:FkbM family methyltransferase